MQACCVFVTDTKPGLFFFGPPWVDGLGIHYLSFLLWLTARLAKPSIHCPEVENMSSSSFIS